jgi:hypothetical protein
MFFRENHCKIDEKNTVISISVIHDVPSGVYDTKAVKTTGDLIAKESLLKYNAVLPSCK